MAGTCDCKLIGAAFALGFDPGLAAIEDEAACVAARFATACLASISLSLTEGDTSPMRSSRSSSTGSRIHLASNWKGGPSRLASIVADNGPAGSIRVEMTAVNFRAAAGTPFTFRSAIVNRRDARRSRCRSTMIIPCSISSSGTA